MINIENIPFMNKDKAIATLKAIHLSNASSETKEPLILACEKRISDLDYRNAFVVKSDFN